MTLAELGLTPSQLAELEALPQALVDAWLSALEHASGLRSPVGWFLAGVRSGIIPGAVPDNTRIQAERYIRKVGYLHQTEDELRDELASRKWAVDERLVELWRSVRPLGEQVEREQLERAQAWRQAHQAVRALYAHPPQTRMVEPSLQAHADTESAGAALADADIAW